MRSKRLTLTYSTLLQVLDDGRLTDGQGRTVDFKNTVIIMTSDFRSQMIQEEAGKSDYNTVKNKLMTMLEQHFKPEFFAVSMRLLCSIL